MIIARVPFRVSFLGGGSDFLPHFRKHGGAVLATAIDSYVYVTVAPYKGTFHGSRYKLAYSRMEQVSELDDIEHPAIREAIRFACPSVDLELHHISDLPACTGLGSSSSFVVGMLQALYGLQNRMVPTHQLASEAIRIEREILRETGGYQDQVLAAYGGINLVEFADGGQFVVRRLPIARERVAEIERHCLLLYTGVRRNSFDVLGEQSRRNGNGQNTNTLDQLAELAREGARLLVGNAPLTGFGELLHEGWQLKKQLADVSLPEIDEAYERARAAGASGGKVLGAGKGGFLLLWAPPDRHEDVVQAVDGGMTPMRIGINAPGATLIHSL